MTISTYISRSKAVDLIVPYAKKNYENLRACKNRISEQIKRNIANGKIRSNDKDRNLLNSSDIAAFYRTKYPEWAPECFRGWPISFRGVAKIGICGRSIVTVAKQPPTIEECHALIIELQAEIDQLKPDAEAWRKLRKRNKENAKK